MVRERESRGIVEEQPPPVNPEEALDRLLRDLRSRREGISDRECAPPHQRWPERDRTARDNRLGA
jgi:hypothetical protein